MEHSGKGTHSGVVLVVDDQAEIRETLEEVLVDLGIPVATAANGREALEKIRAVHPCLILLDLMMPEMNGWEVAEALKRDPTYPEVSVLVVSGAHDAREAAANLGACGFLAKPYELSALLSAIRTYC